jgi:hypothetical protein
MAQRGTAVADDAPRLQLVLNCPLIVVGPPRAPRSPAAVSSGTELR